MGAGYVHRAGWRKNWQAVQTEHAKAAAHALYPLGAAAAAQKRRIPYAEAVVYLNAAGLGYGGRRNSLPLDALAGLCATLNVRDLSALFWSKETIRLSARASPDAPIPRWKSLRDKEAEERQCHRITSWPPAATM